MFCIANECDSDLKCDFFFIKTNGYHKKMCDTNKKVTKM